MLCAHGFDPGSKACKPHVNNAALKKLVVFSVCLKFNRELIFILLIHLTSFWCVNINVQLLLYIAKSTWSKKKKETTNFVSLTDIQLCLR